MAAVFEYDPNWRAEYLHDAINEQEEAAMFYRRAQRLLQRGLNAQAAAEMRIATACYASARSALSVAMGGNYDGDFSAPPADLSDSAELDVMF